MAGKGLQLTVLVTVLTLTMSQVLWQAAGTGWDGAPGSIDAPNLPRLEMVIDEALTELEAGRQSIKSTSKSISEDLNELWDIAWNVVLYQLDRISGLYAFSYQGHWAWYQPYKNTMYSIMSWKDYNCQVWVYFDIDDILTQSQNGNETSVKTTANASLSSRTPISTSTHMWEVNKLIVQTLEDATSLSHTFSGVSFITTPLRLGACFCTGGVGGGMWVYDIYTVANTNGIFTSQGVFRNLAFTTRQGNYRAA